MISPVENKYVEMMTSKVTAIKEHRSINTKLEEISELNLKKLFSVMIEAERHLYSLKVKLHSLSKQYLFDIFNMIDLSNRGYILLDDVRI